METCVDVSMQANRHKVMLIPALSRNDSNQNFSSSFRFKLAKNESVSEWLKEVHIHLLADVYRSGTQRSLIAGGSPRNKIIHLLWDLLSHDVFEWPLHRVHFKSWCNFQVLRASQITLDFHTWNWLFLLIRHSFLRVFVMPFKQSMRVFWWTDTFSPKLSSRFYTKERTDKRCALYTCAWN